MRGVSATHVSVFSLIVLIIVGFALYQFTAEESKGEIVAFCGSASMPALKDAAEKFEEKTGIVVELHFSGSGTMLSQMKMSREGDLYIPGSPDYMVRAINDNVVYRDTVEKIAYLVPAIIVPKGNPEDVSSLEDLAKSGVTVGIGDPDSVCVGGYAVGILKHNGLYDEVEPNIEVHAKSCSDTASLASIGTVDAIIGWRVFYFWNQKKTELIRIERNRIPKISYIPAAISKYTKNRDRGQRFIDFLTSSEGNQSFQKYNYIATEDKARELAPNAKIIECE